MKVSEKILLRFYSGRRGILVRKTLGRSVITKERQNWLSKDVDATN
jgi:hypothetical protein